MIVMIGATGTVGSEVTRRLLLRDEPVRVFTRDPERAAALAAQGAEVTVGDLDRPDTVLAAVAGADAVLLSTTPGPTMVREQTAALAAAREAGVERVVRISAVGAQPGSAVNLLDWHGRLDAALQASAPSWTIVRSLWFAQNYLMQAGSIVGEGAVYGAMGSGKLAPVDVADLAAVAVAALTERGHERQTYAVTGPQAGTQQEIAEAIGAGLGRDVSYVDVPAEDLTSGLTASGLPRWLADGLVGLNVAYAGGLGDLVTDVVSSIGGVTPTTMQAFAAAHAAAFEAAAAGAAALEPAGAA